VTEFAINTARGAARAHLSAPEEGRVRAALILGHGAGGGVNAPDIQAAQRAALTQGLTVVLVEQPYRVAGRRAPPPAAHLDATWTFVVDWLAERELAGMTLVTGGRSMGARVACRTAAATGSAGVLCLAFPLQPPQRANTLRPAPSRLPELEAVTVPVLIIQGRGDRFGMPKSAPGRTVVTVAGDHGLKADLPAVGDAVADWLSGLL